MDICWLKGYTIGYSFSAQSEFQCSLSYQNSCHTDAIYAAYLLLCYDHSLKWGLTLSAFSQITFQQNALFVFVLGKECQNPGKTILRCFDSRSQPEPSLLCPHLISFSAQNAQGLLWPRIGSAVLSIPFIPVTSQLDTAAVVSAPPAWATCSHSPGPSAAHTSVATTHFRPSVQGQRETWESDLLPRGWQALRDSVRLHFYFPGQQEFPRGVELPGVGAASYRSSETQGII